MEIVKVYPPNRHTENGFKLLHYTPWVGCMERRQLVYGGCDCCPWQYECIAREIAGGVYYGGH